MFDINFAQQQRFTDSWTFRLVLINVAVWIIQLIAYPLFTNLFALNPSAVLSGHIYQFFTYMFLHSTYTSYGMIYPMHILLNMFVFVIFGFPVERTIGRDRFLILYFLSGIGSAVIYMAIMNLLIGGVSVSLLGASGAVFGVLSAYAFLFPRNWVYILGLFPLPAAALLVLLLVEEMFFGFLGLQPGIANFGHVGGIVTGLAIMFYWRHKRKRQERKFGERGYQFIWE